MSPHPWQVGLPLGLTSNKGFVAQKPGSPWSGPPEDSAMKKVTRNRGGTGLGFRAHLEPVTTPGTSVSPQEQGGASPGLATSGMN